MSNHTTEITINDIPSQQVIDNKDKIIIDTQEGLKTIALENIVFKNYNTEFGPIIEKNTALLEEINNNFFNAVSGVNINTKLKGAIALYYKMKPSDLTDVIINNKVNYNLPFNFIGANSLADLYTSSQPIISNDGSILLPSGTYRVRAVASFCIRNPGKYYDYTGVYVGEPYGCNITTDIAQVDAPARVLLVGDIKYSPVRALEGKISLTSTVDGFFFLCKTARIAFRVSTDGNITLGDGSINDNRPIKTNLLNYAHYNGITYPAQIIIERVSQDDIYDIFGTDFTEE